MAHYARRVHEKFRWLDDLKLRAGFGVTGNQDIDNYQSLSLLTFGSRFLYDGKWTSTVYPNSNPNPDLNGRKKRNSMWDLILVC